VIDGEEPTMTDFDDLTLPLDVDDLTRQQLAWYVRNCVNGPFVGRLERIFLERLQYLKGIPNDEDDLDLFTVKSRRRLMRDGFHLPPTCRHHRCRLMIAVGNLRYKSTKTETVCIPPKTHRAETNPLYWTLFTRQSELELKLGSFLVALGTETHNACPF
jgi:hypothetical protein